MNIGDKIDNSVLIKRFEPVEFRSEIISKFGHSGGLVYDRFIRNYKNGNAIWSFSETKGLKNSFGFVMIRDDVIVELES